MTSQKEFLGTLVKALDDSNIAYMLSGSMGSSLHGRPAALDALKNKMTYGTG